MTDEEKSFVTYWEEHRLREKKLSVQFVSGLPFGLMFALPVLIALIYHNWYKQITFISNSELVTTIVAVMMIAVFVAVFRKRFLWDQHEQLYKELKFRNGNFPDAAD